ncbi:type II toxin-antitoxin system HipA family toxin [Bradyrhizobium elkanii]|uniref:type II toxin-antitoxin system HipA family toxin n=1 Tax=Bradyrhizobium elkanii TaxID=29448 RepID=UPI002168F59B|nr:HipA domain-containing protein [Bradyrhizobium elkanii]MCS3519275.1 serine/threonine-protein kinase HipA [Bradyrhizobium elkanii]MCS4066932.1 serine/threonine-protein kinase HipA [Bradyrhizobium elkanii]MCS4082467.1 serine/threonine-protein kinase HipA [Bradyrhizobium elkanii]MCW2127914.1 serine/threonine-protein kinase HipA [Bradyrhizobium elkanii]MCW2174657.1 serine/threonine-protein kinase HipA [Bradyrhizobium elkanii]
MTSDSQYKEAYVWTWLRGQAEPIVAGLLSVNGAELVFNYGRSYLERKDATSLYEPELPLRSGILLLLPGLRMPSSIRDAAPDAWGRRVILNRKFGARGREIDAGTLDELTFLLESGSDRIGALDFQVSPTVYAAREGKGASLAELLNAAELVEKGTPLTPELDRTLFHGSSIGGARPKATITSNDKKFIAKFSSQSDIYSVVKAEYIAMRLAEEVGLTVAPVSLQRVAGKDILLTERFDREKVATGWARRSMVSALTLLELDELMARYASYDRLATVIRHRFLNPKETLRELFSRVVFNILCGNTDDHARNHAAFWSDGTLTLTPAYDICPQSRAGGEATQAMLILGQDRHSQIALCLKAAPSFLLNEAEAAAIVVHQIKTIQERWSDVCDEAALGQVDRSLFWRRQFLNPYAFIGAPENINSLVN